MTYYNTGSFSTKTMKDMKALAKIINEEELYEDALYGLDLEDAYEYHGRFHFDFNGLDGDLDQDLKNIAEACQKKHLDVEFEIEYDGDSEGVYLFHNGKYEQLEGDEYYAYKMDEDILLKEIYRRGLDRRICSETLYHFMQPVPNTKQAMVRDFETYATENKEENTEENTMNKIDNKKQKEKVIKYLENTYMGAKMVGDEEIMERISRAIFAFKADLEVDIFKDDILFEQFMKNN